MLSADILAEVVRGVPVRPSPTTKQTTAGNTLCVSKKVVYLSSLSLLLQSNFLYWPRRILEAGGVAYELSGLEGVTGMDGLPAEGHDRSARSVSLPRLLDGRLSFWRTASSCRRSGTDIMRVSFLWNDNDSMSCVWRTPTLVPIAFHIVQKGNCRLEAT